MKRLKKFIQNITLTLGIVAGAGGITGCESWETNLEDKLQEKGFTYEQAEVGAAVGLRRIFTEKVEDKKAGTVTYKFNYNVIKDDEVLQVVEELYGDIRWLLDYEGSICYLKYLKNTGRGEHLEKQEKVFKYIKDVLREKVLKRKFDKLVGNTSSNWERNYGWGGGYPGLYYNEGETSESEVLLDKRIKGMRKENAMERSENPEEELRKSWGGYGGYGWRNSKPEEQFKVKEDEKFTLADLINAKDIEFDTDEVKKARKRGDLKDDKFKVEKVNTDYEFWGKVDNPQYNVDHGEKPFIFKKVKAGLKIIGFNIDNDKENKSDYIEVYRVNERGKLESKPVIKVFKPADSDSLEVIVADRDFEGEGGYGKPDWVGRPDLFINNTRDLMEFSELINFIFQKRLEEEKRKKPDLDVEMNKIYIVRAGTLPMNAYTCGDECWERFLPDYKEDPNGKLMRYRVHVRKDIPDGVEMHEVHNKGFPIEWIALQYLGGRSRVVEFYNVKKEFTGKNLKTNVFGRRVSIEKEDGEIKNYDIKAVIEDKPYRIDFDRNYQKRWEIKDKDGDGACFECKRERARPDNVIPKR